jgi:drug/metabolite transporter (DMT)-like permease
MDSGLAALRFAPRNDELDDSAHRYADRTDRDPDVVAARRADGGDRKNSGLPTGGDDIRDRPDAVRALWQPPVAWIVGVGGLFGYHALYFLALRFAPPAEAGLLNYLWPLLIVLFSALLPGERLAPHHIIGAVLGLAGTILLFAGNSSGFAPGQVPGLIAAFVAAFVWAAYSVMSRKLKAVPTDAVAGFCAVTALLAAIVHGLAEVTIWPDTMVQWLAIVALGVGPVGAAFYAWDIGMKRGDIRVLGAASYATPLLSTAFLILAGFARPSANIAIAAVLIAGGGLIAARDMLRKRPQ